MCATLEYKLLFSNKCYILKSNNYVTLFNVRKLKNERLTIYNETKTVLIIFKYLFTSLSNPFTFLLCKCRPYRQQPGWISLYDIL